MEPGQVQPAGSSDGAPISGAICEDEQHGEESEADPVV